MRAQILVAEGFGKDTMVELSDAELVTRTRAGDNDAYRELMARYQGHVYGSAYSIVDNWADAQDMAQEAFIRAYCNLDQLRDAGRFAAWLRRVTFALTLDWLKTFRPKLFGQLGSPDDLDSLEIPDFAPGPPEVTERRALADAVLEAVASLPPKYRVPLTMFHLDGLSYQKVADFLDIPMGTVQSLIHRAREKLRPALTAYGGEGVSSMVKEVFDEHKLSPEFASKVIAGLICHSGMGGIMDEGLESSPPSPTRAFAARLLAMSRQDTETIVQLLKRALSDPNKKVRAFALRALLAIEVDDERKRKQFVPLITPLLADRSRSVRSFVVNALRRFAADVPLERVAQALVDECDLDKRPLVHAFAVPDALIELLDAVLKARTQGESRR